MNWNGYGRPAPTQAGDHHTPLLLQLNQAISDLHHSSGRIEATLEHIGVRLESGDGQFREIREDLQRIEGKVATLETSKGEAKASRIEHLKTLAETLLPAIKEAWPFLAVLIAGGAKALGYDLSWLITP